MLLNSNQKQQLSNKLDQLIDSVQVKGSNIIIKGQSFKLPSTSNKVISETTSLSR